MANIAIIQTLHPMMIHISKFILMIDDGRHSYMYLPYQWWYKLPLLGLYRKVGLLQQTESMKYNSTVVITVRTVNLTLLCVLHCVDINYHTYYFGVNNCTLLLISLKQKLILIDEIKSNKIKYIVNLFFPESDTFLNLILKSVAQWVRGLTTNL